MKRNFPAPLGSTRAGMIAGALLIGGAVAWIVALAAVWLSARNREPSGPDRPPTALAEVPTLSAVTGTPWSTATPAPTRTGTPSITPAPTMIPMLTPTFAFPATATPDNAESASPVPETGVADAGTAVPGACAPPDGWERYVVQPGDTLFAFVLGAGGTDAVTVDDLVAANCLSGRYLYVDQVIFLPSGAAANAPPSEPFVPASELYARGPRTPNCPCAIRVADGWRREQIAEAINAAETWFTGGDFLAVTGADASAPFDFLGERPPGTTMEGFLFPGVYTVQNDTTAEAFRDALLAAFAANITPQMRADAAAQGVTFYQALVIASIVQRETRVPDNQKLVASVIYNRYRDGNRIASSITVLYPLGGPGNWWPRVTGTALKTDSPYNTYDRAGLPPTPIDNPGLTAILAAVYAPQTDYYYHNAACDGSGEVFSVTYEEHLKTVNCE